MPPGRRINAERSIDPDPSRLRPRAFPNLEVVYKLPRAVGEMSHRVWSSRWLPDWTLKRRTMPLASRARARVSRRQSEHRSLEGNREKAEHSPRSHESGNSMRPANPSGTFHNQFQSKLKREPLEISPCMPNASFFAQDLGVSNEMRDVPFRQIGSGIS